MAPKTKRKRVHTQIRTNVPVLHRDSVVTRVEVSRSTRKKILTKSQKVTIPVDVSASLQSPSLQTPEFPLSDIDNDPDPSAGKTRKGPSRSVSVCVTISVDDPTALTTKRVD